MKPLLCSCCEVETTDRVQNEARKPTDWALYFVTWNEKKACICSRCYDVLQEQTKEEDDDDPE